MVTTENIWGIIYHSVSSYSYEEISQKETMERNFPYLNTAFRDYSNHRLQSNYL